MLVIQQQSILTKTMSNSAHPRYQSPGWIQSPPSCLSTGLPQAPDKSLIDRYGDKNEPMFSIPVQQEVVWRRPAAWCVPVRCHLDPQTQGSCAVGMLSTLGQSFAPVLPDPFCWHNHTCKLIEAGPTQAQADIYQNNLSCYTEVQWMQK